MWFFDRSGGAVPRRLHPCFPFWSQTIGILLIRGANAPGGIEGQMAMPSRTQEEKNQISRVGETI